MEYVRSWSQGGGGATKGFTRQSNDRAWVDEFWGGERIDYGQGKVACMKNKEGYGRWSMADARTMEKES